MSKPSLKVNAYLTIEVHCNCPHCGSFQDVFEDVRESLGDDHRADEINIAVECSDCGKDFIVKNVRF